MNIQKDPNGIEWTRIRLLDGTYLVGRTWNYVAGCKHGCRWTMPDGKVAVCYAETVAERLAQAAYPNGFAHHYVHSKRLNEPLNTKVRSGIFLDSMSDLMGAWVPQTDIDQVLNVTWRAHWHIFQLLTKNAPRLLKQQFAPNVWVGASSPPDIMYGGATVLTQRAKVQMLERTLDVLAQMKDQGRAKVTWLSAEPLSWDISGILAKYPSAVDWVVVGAASNGAANFPPQEQHLRATLDVLDSQRVPVFFKGNLRSLDWARDNWRDAFPAVA
jgi:protein gp37